MRASLIGQRGNDETEFIMQIIDRYAVRLFFKVLLICWFSLTGLYWVIDAFNNLDEFMDHADQTKSSVWVALINYYSIRALWFFDRSAGLLTLIAGVFALAWMKRSNELTALMAAGIRPARVIRPILTAAAFVSLVAVVNREVIIPRFALALTKKAQTLDDHQPQKFLIRYDGNDLSIEGKAAVPASGTIVEPVFGLPFALRHFGRRISAKTAQYLDEDNRHKAGYWLREVILPAKISKLRSAQIDEQHVILTAKENDWLGEDECFVVSNVDFQELVAGANMRRFLSTWEMVRFLYKRNSQYSTDVRVAVHGRFVQPVLDLCLLLLGLPLVMSRQDRSIFLVAGHCMLVVCGFIIVVLACQAMGTTGYLLSPAMAAWLPVFIFVPITTFVTQPLWE